MPQPAILPQHNLSLRYLDHALPDDGLGFVRRGLTGYAQTACACGLDTGVVGNADARRAFADHAEATGLGAPAVPHGAR